jgi:hypothetical protein
MLKPRLPKPKVCKGCRNKFKPIRPFQEACGVLCAIQVSQAKKAKKAKQESKERRRETKQRKERLKTTGDHLKEAQTAFNAFIRERDKDEPCISCGRHHQGQYHAGHYRSVGSTPELRFCEDNVQKQCAPCNNHLSGNPIEYRIRLVEKIGLARVEWIEGSHDPARYRIDDAKRIKQEYKDKLKELKNAGH